jgi:hypothetical protein
MGQRNAPHSPNPFDQEAAAAMRVMRWRRPPVSVFARELGNALDRGPLSRQAIYNWESGKNRVPAAALLAAAELVGMQLEDVRAAARRLLGPMGSICVTDRQSK